MMKIVVVGATALFLAASPIALLVVPLIAASTAQAAAASERHHTRTSGRAVACEQLPNYAARGDIAAESYWQNYANGIMAAHPAGR
jgi:hypothetical protein